MEAAPERNRVLAELEFLQNDLIARLDELDQRVCRVLKEWTAVRQADELSSPTVPVTATGAERPVGSSPS